jgi:hypothetical protein
METKKQVAAPVTKEILQAARKAFRVRSAVQAFTPREALALGLIRRDFGPKGAWRVRIGKIILGISSFVRRLRGKPVDSLDPAKVEKALNHPAYPPRMQAILEAARNIEPQPECGAMTAYRELVGGPYGFPRP